MQTVDERPADAEATGRVTQTKSQDIQPIGIEYVRFEEESIWTRSRTWIWALLILIFLGIGFGAMILPAFVIGC